MRLSIAAGFAGLLSFCVILQASFLPTVHLDTTTLKAFENYISVFEKHVPVEFTESGKLWIDNECCGKHSSFDSGKPVVEPRDNDDIANGSIHHFSGVIHLKGATIDSVRRVMEDYPNYTKYFRPDLGSASGSKEPDSTAADEHFHANLVLVQTTIWMDVTFDTVYDTHYRRLGKDRWTARSTALSIKEMKNVKRPEDGFFPEGDDHGFLWRTNTYWFARERNGGLDLQADSISLSRPNVPGFGWWGTRRTKDAVDKMLRDIKMAVDAQR